MNRLPDNLPALLRAEGLKVTALPGWKRRGRPASTGGFDPVGVLCHHTVTTVAWTVAAVLRLLTGGRTGLPGPLAQIGLTRKGRVFIIAAGRANHAGHARASGSVASGDGNRLYVGIEAFNAGTGERWPKVQYDAYVLLCAALCKHVTGNSIRTVRAHRETSTTGKIDPAGPTPYEGHFDMAAFRRRVGALLTAITTPAPREDDDMGYADWSDKDKREFWADHQKHAIDGPANAHGAKGEKAFRNKSIRWMLKQPIRILARIENRLARIEREIDQGKA